MMMLNYSSLAESIYVNANTVSWGNEWHLDFLTYTFGHGNIWNAYGTGGTFGTLERFNRIQEIESVTASKNGYLLTIFCSMSGSRFFVIPIPKNQRIKFRFHNLQFLPCLSTTPIHQCSLEAFCKFFLIKKKYDKLGTFALARHATTSSNRASLL